MLNIERTAEPKVIRLTHRIFRRIRKVKNFARDIKYTAKMLRGIASGYDDLQESFDNPWEYIEYAKNETRAHDGAYTSTIKYDTHVVPYHVCVSWKNHTHTPLPIVIDAESAYTIQNAVVRTLHWLWNNAFPLCPSAFREAVMGCARYENQFDAKGEIRC